MKASFLCANLILLNQLINSAYSESSHNSESTIVFGEANPPSLHVPIVDEASSVSPKQFFSSYVAKSEAVLFKRAIVKSPAYQLWNDDYFLNLKNIPDNHDVLIENRKIENRTSPPTRMPFKEFVQIYNVTDQYMVESVPVFLRKDYMLPHHLQCDKLMRDIIVETMMWFSSGGTSSVVHTDSVENMNCLVAGRKRFVFVPPKYADLVLFDHPEGSYSGIDVDDVDYTKYPGLADVKFMHADVEAGDCLYIPYKWIHQVRSYDRNVAVNIWWDKFRSLDLNIDECDMPFDPSWTLDKVDFLGFAALDNSPAMIKDFLTGVIKKKAMTLDEFIPQLHITAMLADPGFIDTVEYHQLLEAVGEMFNVIDINSDKHVDASDLKLMSSEDWERLIQLFTKISEIEEAAQYLEELEGVGHESHDEL